MISIITSLYKSEKYLKNFLKNVINLNNFLTSHNVEAEFLLISNDTNAQEEILLSEVSTYSNIKIIKCERESIYSSWNRGIDNATYNIMTFWNVDDERYPDAIIDGINLIRQGAEIVYFPFIYKRYVNVFGVNILVKRKRIDPPEYDREKFMRGMYCGASFIFTKNAIEKNQKFDGSFKIAGDFDWCSRAAKNNLIFAKSNVTVGVFTNNGKTLSGSKNPLQEAENEIILNRI